MNSFSEYPYSVEPALSTHPVLSRHHAVPHEWLPNTGSTGSEIPVVIKYNKQIHEHFYGRFNGGPKAYSEYFLAPLSWDSADEKQGPGTILFLVHFQR